eukprot:GHUV01009237.1.p1 GENE.GHUV01009237.1~~GHUV01009237.1.p1  ORF type:complete len:134 (+),score=18.07 GHUV01009237.1:356-757(+)
MYFRASAMLACFMAALLLATAVPSAHGYRYLLDQSKLQQCKDAYSAAGLNDSSTVKGQVPDCRSHNIDVDKCCGEVKGVLSSGSGPSDCLCDQDFWNFVQGQVLGAGIPNLNSDTLIAFTKACNIKNKGAGTC